ATDRTVERGWRDRQRRGSGVDREDVWLVLLVRAERRDDDLHVVAEPFGEERSDRPVGQTSREDPLLGGAALAPWKGAWDLAGGVQALLEVDGEREEVDAGSHGGRDGRRREYDGVAIPHGA